MNSTKKNSEFGGVKKKLTAAIAMLLVATIMMVSSTYAWFTLSTAPEVTGITTSVGANGNLEMALLPTTGDASTISTAVGDSTKPLTERNTTWGNLVDLSETSYNLSNVTLNPARLNVTGDEAHGWTVATSQLLTAQYGNDGRVTTLAENTTAGIWDTTKGSFQSGDTYGVRAIGTASGMTARQLGYRNAVAAANTAASDARNEGNRTMVANGEALAKILVNHYAGNSADETYTTADLTAIKNMATGLKSALQNVNSALRNYLIAQVATSADMTDETFSTAKSTIEQAVKLSTLTNYTGPDGFSGVVSEVEADLETVDQMITNTQTLLDQNKDSYTWDEISSLLDSVVKKDGVSVNGNSLAGAIDKNKMVQDILNAGFQVRIELTNGSGLFANVAKYAGTYEANLMVNGIKVDKLTANLNTNITAKCTGDSSLKTVSTKLSSAPSAGKGANANNTITDTYGYIIDLAVRTNAASAKLQLSEAQQRIYDGSDNADTMGKGSTMSFKTSEGFGDAQVKALMTVIRVVFLDGDGKVLGVAALDMEKAALDAEKGWTAPLHLYKYKIAAGDANAKTGALSLAKTEEGKLDKAANGDVLCELAQNTATKISALVYLDGDSVDNSDVANAARSMTGSMNLQFSTNVDLVPMHYTPLEGTITKPTTATTSGND